MDPFDRILATVVESYRKSTRESDSQFLLKPDEIQRLCEQTRSTFERQPMLAQIDARITIHIVGQFRNANCYQIYAGNKIK